MNTPADAPAKLAPEIFVYATNKAFLNIYDALTIDRVKVELASYDATSGRQTGRAGAYLGVDDLRLLAHLILTRQLKDVLPKSRFERFGGSTRDGQVESRTLVLEWDPGEGGRFAGYPYRLTIANGAGQKTATGAVQPKGEPSSKLSLRLPEADLMKILLAAQAYLAAWELTHHGERVARNVADQAARRESRAEAPPARPAPTLRVVPPTEATPAVTYATPTQVAAILKAFEVLRKSEADRRAILGRYRVQAVKFLTAEQAEALLAELRAEYVAAQRKGGAA